MDMLKRELAPIPAEAWTEIDAQAIRSSKAILSARKVIDVTGPMGTDFPGVPEGRLEFPKKQPKSSLLRLSGSLIFLDGLNSNFFRGCLFNLGKRQAKHAIVELRINVSLVD